MALFESFALQESTGRLQTEHDSTIAVLFESYFVDLEVIADWDEKMGLKADFAASFEAFPSLEWTGRS